MSSTLAKAYVQIVPSTEGIKSKLEASLNKETQDVGDSAGKSIGKNIASAITKAIVVAGIGKAIKTAVSEGAALEQSIGGIETLFGAGGQSLKEYAKSVGQTVSEALPEYNKLIQAQEKMIQNADVAYKTAGLSANEYMETATSFAASLVSSLGGDTQKAADAANTAIIDMADNSNKMGTAMESIQNAYQGFAKQNYTMLDNLKLGYGGTKEEMQRLLADAQKLSGVKYDLSNLSDVYEAIHVIQQNLGITGTTAKEASSTISGSFASMQAAAKNLAANMALGRDVEGAFRAVVSTTETYLLKNLMPMVSRIFSSIPEILIDATNELPEFLNSIFEQITTIVTNMLTSLPQILSNIGNSLMSAIPTLISTVGPQLFYAALEMIQQLGSGFATNIPIIIAEIMPMLLSLSETLLEYSETFIEAGMNILLQIVDGLMLALPTLIEFVPQIITNICNIINDNMPQIIAAAIAIVIALGQGIIQSIPTIIANTGNIVEAIFSAIMAVNWLNLGKSILTAIADGIKAIATTPVNIIKDIGKNIIGVFKNGSWENLGKAVIDGIKNGLKNGAEAIASAAKSVANSALKAAKSFLGIHSPSRVFRDEVGEMVDLGLAEGIEQNASDITDAMDEVSGIVTEPIKADIQSSIEKGSNTSISTGSDKSDSDVLNELLEKLPYMGDITIPVYIGNERIEKIVIKAINRNNYRSGGR